MRTDTKWEVKEKNYEKHLHVSELDSILEGLRSKKLNMLDVFACIPLIVSKNVGQGICKHPPQWGGCMVSMGKFPLLENILCWLWEMSPLKGGSTHRCILCFSILGEHQLEFHHHHLKIRSSFLGSTLTNKSSLLRRNWRDVNLLSIFLHQKI